MTNHQGFLFSLLDKILLRNAFAFLSAPDRILSQTIDDVGYALGCSYHHMLLLLMRGERLRRGGVVLLPLNSRCESYLRTTYVLDVQIKFGRFAEHLPDLIWFPVLLASELVD